MSLIELTNVCKNYKMDKVIVKAVDEASFSIEKGDFAAISGPSGSGKSTLLYSVSGMDKATSGEIKFAGEDLTKLRAFAKKIVEA